MKKEFQEIVLSARQDDFYRRNMYANFGDIGVAVKARAAAEDPHGSQSSGALTWLLWGVGGCHSVTIF